MSPCVYNDRTYPSPQSLSLSRSLSLMISFPLSFSPSTCYPLKSVSLSLSPCSDLLFKLPKFHSLFRFTPPLLLLSFSLPLSLARDSASFLCSLSHLWLPNFQYLLISLTYLDFTSASLFVAFILSLFCLSLMTFSLVPLTFSLLSLSPSLLHDLSFSLSKISLILLLHRLMISSSLCHSLFVALIFPLDLN